MIRRSVVLPEPEGPSRARSAPLGTSRLTLSSARNLSKRLVTRVIRMPIRSEYHRARADEERELRALLGAEDHTYQLKSTEHLVLPVLVHDKEAPTRVTSRHHLATATS